MFCKHSFQETSADVSRFSAIKPPEPETTANQMRSSHTCHTSTQERTHHTLVIIIAFRRPIEQSSPTVPIAVPYPAKTIRIDRLATTSGCPLIRMTIRYSWAPRSNCSEHLSQPIVSLPRAAIRCSAIIGSKPDSPSIAAQQQADSISNG